MARKPDLEKIRKIVEVLKKNPDGLWVRELARRTGLPKSTVSKYVNEYMKDKVEDVWRKEFIRIIRLRK